MYCFVCSKVFDGEVETVFARLIFLTLCLKWVSLFQFFHFCLFFEVQTKNYMSSFVHLAKTIFLFFKTGSTNTCSRNRRSIRVNEFAGYLPRTIINFRCSEKNSKVQERTQIGENQKRRFSPRFKCFDSPNS